MRSWFRAAALALAFWSLLAGLFLLIGWTWPKTATGWVFTLGAGPLVYLMFEGIGTGLVYAGQRVLARTAFADLSRDLRRPPPLISPRRVFAGVLAAVLLIGLMCAVFYAFGRLLGDGWLDSANAFVERHFY